MAGRLAGWLAAGWLVKADAVTSTGSCDCCCCCLLTDGGTWRKTRFFRCVMVWPLITLGIGIGAFAARHGLRALRQSKLEPPKFLVDIVKWRQSMLDYSRNLQGFEATMSASEACKILNVS